MNIVIFSPSMELNKGGVERHVLEVAKRLLKNNEVTIITEAKNKESMSKYFNYHSRTLSANEAEIVKDTVKSSFFIRKKIEKINIFYFYFGDNGFKKKFVIWRRMIQIVSFIRKADIIHCHDVFIWIIPLRLIFPFKKIYITFHGYEGYPIALKAKIIRGFSKILSNGSINVGKFIEKWYGTKANKTTFGAVDISEFKKVININSVKNNTETKIAFIGRLEKINCLPQLFHALKLLKDKKVKFTIEWYGDGGMRNQCSKVGRVFTQRSDLQANIALVDLVFSTSYLSILEGLINKKRVFSLYDNPLKKDYLLLTPFSDYICATSNSKQLAQEIESFIDNKAKSRADVESGYHWARKQTWDALAKMYLDLWKV